MEKIKNLRNKTGLSQIKFADVLGVSVASLRRWEKGDTSPSPMALEKINMLEDAIEHNKLQEYISLNTKKALEVTPKEITRSFKYNGQVHNVEYMPYVYNGPADQIDFYNQLIDMQEQLHMDMSWEKYKSRLSIVKSTESSFTDQFYLEKPSKKQKSWSGNAGAHGWHRYVGRFPAQVIRAIFNKFQLKESDVVLDPFCGSGTTLVEARLLGIPAIGIEISPLSAIISQVKSNFNSNTKSLRECLSDLSVFYDYTWDSFLQDRDIEDVSYTEIINRKGNEVNEFPNYQKWFSKSALLGTSIIVEYIKIKGIESFISKLILVALSAKMRSIGNVDVDVVRAEYRKEPRQGVDVKKLVISQLKKMISSIDLMNSSHEELIGSKDSIKVINGSCETVSINDSSINAIITSPPYGVESLSYLRTHLLSFRALESILGVDPYNFSEEVIGSEYVDKNYRFNPNINLTPTFNKFFKRMLENQELRTMENRIFAMMKFFADMDTLAKKFNEWLVPGGKIAFIIGNKKLGEDIIPTDTIITEIFNKYGLLYEGKIEHKLKTNNSNSQVPWQDRIIKNEFIMFFEKRQCE